VPQKNSSPIRTLDFGGPGPAFRAGLRLAFGVPATVLGASYVGFGAMVHQAGLELWHGVASVVSAWALPGQIALVDLYGDGASLLAIAIAVAVTNARLLPMAITLVPLMRSPGTPRWRYYLAAHFIAVTGWALAMRDCPAMPAAQRLPYFAGVVMVLWCVSMLGASLGFFLVGGVPAYVTLGLVFLNPVYFMLVIAGDVRIPSRVIAALLGAVAGPLLYMATPDWSLLLTGLGAGSLAYVLGRARPSWR
jgi:predicted branched-subunit amino acid permease